MSKKYNGGKNVIKLVSLIKYKTVNKIDNHLNNKENDLTVLFLVKIL